MFFYVTCVALSSSKERYLKTVLTCRFGRNSSAQMGLPFVAIIIYIMAKQNSSQFLLYNSTVTTRVGFLITLYVKEKNIILYVSDSVIAQLSQETRLKSSCCLCIYTCFLFPCFKQFWSWFYKSLVGSNCKALRCCDLSE